MLKLLFKHVYDDNKVVANRCIKIAQSLGFFVDGDFLIPIVLEAISS